MFFLKFLRISSADEVRAKHNCGQRAGKCLFHVSGVKVAVPVSFEKHVSKAFFDRLVVTPVS